LNEGFALVFIPIFSQINPNAIWNSQNWLASWKLKGFKILKNVKTKWIYMLSLAKRVMVEYQILLTMMDINIYINSKLQPTLSILYDMFLSLVCNIFPIWKQSIVW
jgi:hypothetical protein